MFPLQLIFQCSTDIRRSDFVCVIRIMPNFGSINSTVQYRAISLRHLQRSEFYLNGWATRTSHFRTSSLPIRSVLDSFLPIMLHAEQYYQSFTTIGQLVKEVLILTFYLCNQTKRKYGISQVVDVMEQILPSTLVYSTAYWIFYGDQGARTSICVCSRFGLRCRHNVNGNCIKIDPIKEKYEFFQKNFDENLIPFDIIVSCTDVGALRCVDVNIKFSLAIEVRNKMGPHNRLPDDNFLKLRLGITPTKTNVRNIKSQFTPNPVTSYADPGLWDEYMCHHVYLTPHGCMDMSKHIDTVNYNANLPSVTMRILSFDFVTTAVYPSPHLEILRLLYDDEISESESDETDTTSSNSDEDSWTLLKTTDNKCCQTEVTKKSVCTQTEQSSSIWKPEDAEWSFNNFNPFMKNYSSRRRTQNAYNNNQPVTTNAVTPRYSPFIQNHNTSTFASCINQPKKVVQPPPGFYNLNQLKQYPLPLSSLHKKERQPTPTLPSRSIWDWDILGRYNKQESKGSYASILKNKT